jgi:hypothetical protein
MFGNIKIDKVSQIAQAWQNFYLSLIAHHYAFKFLATFSAKSDFSLNSD